MPLDVIMPALGMTQESGRLVAWHKKPGDEVAEGDVLFDVETDKAVQEVEAAGAGFLTNVTAYEGDDIPVGDVIARISDTAEDDAETSAAADKGASGDVPTGHEVIMPSLGMAQDTGRLVAWTVSPGDRVAEGDVLFEVETDKAVQEVEAQQGGHVAALLAEEGEDVPTGQVIAILTDDAPPNPIRRSAGTPPVKPAGNSDRNLGSEEHPTRAKRPDDTRASRSRQVPKPVHGTSGGRIRASPKLRRLALERGLDLARLVETGVPQPYHVRDLERLEALCSDTAATARPSARRLTAEVSTNAFVEFSAWLADTEVSEAAAIATFAATAFGNLQATAAVERPGSSSAFHVPSDRLASARPSDDPPDLIVRDLRETALIKVDLGAGDVPVVTLTRSGPVLSLTFECNAAALSATEAIAALSGFAERLEDPLRHLL